MSLEPLNASDILEWIKVPSKSQDVIAKLDFAFAFWQLVKHSGIKLEEQKWINAASGNEAEAAKLYFLLDFWEQFKSIDGKVKYLEDAVLAGMIEGSGSGICSWSMPRKQGAWKKKRKLLHDELETDRPKWKAQKLKSSGTPIDLYFQDVARVEKDLSLKHSLLLAELPDPKKRYETPESRLKVLWYILTFDFPEEHSWLGPIESVQPNTSTTMRTGDGSVLAHHVFHSSSTDSQRKQNFGKRQSEATTPRDEKRPRLAPELVSSGQGGIAENFSLLSVDEAFTYLGRGQAENSADCVLWYRWGGFPAMTFLREAACEQYDDGLWVYYEANRSLVDSLENKKLSQSIKQCTTWKKEKLDGTTACLRIRFPNSIIIRNFQCDVFVEAIVSKEDAPSFTTTPFPEVTTHLE